MGSGIPGCGMASMTFTNAVFRDAITAFASSGIPALLIFSLALVRGMVHLEHLGIHFS